MGQVDLHVHSTASDGRLSPEEVVAKAAGLGLKVMALTDHDSIEGIVPALKAATVFTGLKVIPGVVPNLLSLCPGCRFVERCSEAMDRCRRSEPEISVNDGIHLVRCWRCD